MVAAIAVATSMVAGKFWQAANVARLDAEQSAELARENAELARKNAELATTNADFAKQNEATALWAGGYFPLRYYFALRGPPQPARARSGGRKGVVIKPAPSPPSACPRPGRG